MSFELKPYFLVSTSAVEYRNRMVVKNQSINQFCNLTTRMITIDWRKKFVLRYQNNVAIEVQEKREIDR